MRSKHNKTPQVHLTSEQLIKQSQLKEQRDGKLKFIKDSFYPALIKATSDIEDAVQNLTVWNSVMMEAFLEKMKEVKFGELKLEEKLSVDDPHYEELKAMLEIFNDLSVFEAKEYIEGVKAEINVFKEDYWKGKSLEELPAKWIDDM